MHSNFFKEFDGWLAELGVVDFAVGIVIHTSVGMGALAAAIVLGRRRFFGPVIEIPPSIPLAVVGSSLLWLGWFGFNAGSALASGRTGRNYTSIRFCKCRTFICDWHRYWYCIILYTCNIQRETKD